MHLYSTVPAVWLNKWAVAPCRGSETEACITGKWEAWWSSAWVVDDAACGSTLVGIFPLLEASVDDYWSWRELENIHQVHQILLVIVSPS